MKMNKTGQYAEKFIKNVPKNIWKEIENKAKFDLMLLGTSDKDVANFIVKNQLTQPEKLAKFIVDVQVVQVIELHDSIYRIRQDYKNEWKSKLESARDMFEYGMNNPKKRDEELGFARRQVMDCIRVFENDVMEHIEKVRQIDNSSDFYFWFSSISSVGKCKKEIEFAMSTLYRLLNAYELLFVIAANTTDDITSLEKQYDAMRTEIIAGDNCLLMAAYCKKKEDKDYWYGLSSFLETRKKFFLEGREVFGIETNDDNFFWDDDGDDIEMYFSDKE